MSAAVQFYGQDAVIMAAKNRDCPRWAMFSGRQFLFKHEGTDPENSLNFLDEILSTLDKSGSVATYTLKFYEEPGKIKENTPCDGSFNFRLVEEEERQQRRVLYNQMPSEIMKRLDAIEARQIAQEEEDDEDEEPQPNTLNGVLVGLLKEPAKIEQMIGLAKMIFGGKSAPAGIGNIPAQPPAEGAEDQKIAEAIAILKANDPRLGDHLLKLAAIATSNKASFDFLLKTLESN